MDFNLAPQKADATLIGADSGGGYRDLTTPGLAEWKLGARSLLLYPRGLILPHYAGSGRIGYVIQGTCTVGMVAPNSPQEEVFITNKGDAIPVPMGTISWWFNGGDSDVSIIFLGETSQSYTPGEINHFFLTGTIGFLNGFSSEFISKTYNINGQDSNKLAKSQTNLVVLKVDDKIKMPNPSSNSNKEKYVTNLEKLLSCNVDAEINADNFTLLEKVGLSARLVRLEPNSVLAPSYSTDGSHRIIYVTKGSGKIQMIGLNGQQKLVGEVERYFVFVVPKFFAIAQIAGDEGMEFFSVTTSSRPVIEQLYGNSSPWKALSSPVLEASLNVDSNFVECFKTINV